MHVEGQAHPHFGQWAAGYTAPCRLTSLNVQPTHTFLQHPSYLVIPNHPRMGLGYVLDVPGGPASGENHEIDPIAGLGNRYHLNVVSFDIHQNLLDLRQIQKAITAVNGGQRTEPYLLFP
ncbi:uncharacterized protein HKW66_Vig0243150 [Vigna angularis]|uniref:Uncharacterized protein n=1 Tax=Phaseolus angularis TaxID=3914 RepID=A0A8T0JPZ3_PHAAN|nr:uncharacterized protein HKW66_Vig0243150 [Vigna angularis]